MPTGASSQPRQIEFAVHEATHFLGVEPDDVTILSIGTTSSRFSLGHQSGLNLGLLQWGKDQRLVQAAVSSQQQLDANILNHNFQSRFVRVDWEQSPEQQSSLGIDVANEAAQQTLRGLANSAFRAKASAIAEFVQHVPAAPTFHHSIKE